MSLTNLLTHIVTVPTNHLRYTKVLEHIGNDIVQERIILQQRWDTSQYKDGGWEVTSEWRDIPIEGEQNDLGKTTI